MFLIPLLIAGKVEISILYYISTSTVQIESLCPTSYKAQSGYCQLDPNLKLLSSGVINISKCLDSICFEGYACLIENNTDSIKEAHVGVVCTHE